MGYVGSTCGLAADAFKEALREVIREELHAAYQAPTPFGPGIHYLVARDRSVLI